MHTAIPAQPTAIPLPESPAPAHWAPLRTDLQFHRVQEDAQHSTWMLYDPLRGQYVELGELELLVLQHWHLGSAQNVAAAIGRTQGCALDPRQIESIARFVSDNELLQTSSAQMAQKQAGISPLQQRLARVQQTLFWRRPLFTPEFSSRVLLPLARCTCQRWYYFMLAAVVLVCAISVGQHWPEFLAYFDASWNAAGAVIFFLCYLLLSLVHELGHASVARAHGVRANSIGVGLIALMPIMYSEITDAWRLPRRARLQISAAGVVFEFSLGVAAAIGWCLLDDGPLRALMFYLFTTSLVTTLLINANPLMKFDGYYLLGDFLGEKNLQQTASASLRQWSWGQLLRDHPVPQGRRQKLLVLFGLVGLLYRLSVFAMISYAAYQLLFKAAGIFVFILCIGLLLVIPAWREISAFIAHMQKQRNFPGKNNMPSETKDDSAQQASTRRHWLSLLRSRALFSASLLLVLLLVPLPWPVQLPASTFFAGEQKIMAPASATLQTLDLQPGDTVHAGQLIAELRNNELDYHIARTREELALLARRQHSDGFAESLDALDGVYLQDLLSKQQLLRALETERQQLQVHARVSGSVDWMLPGLHTGHFLELNQPFLSIADPASLAGRAYGEAQQIAQLGDIAPGETLQGRLFIAGQWQPIAVVVQRIEQIASRRIQDPALTSVNGGPLQMLPDDNERSAEAFHLITFAWNAETDLPPVTTAQRTGHLVLLRKPVSLLQLFTQRVAGVLIRESGV